MGHGLLVEVSVTGAQEAVDAVAIAVNLDCESNSSTAMARHGEITVASDSISASSEMAACGAVEPEPPVSSTLTAPSDMRVNVNFGYTLSDESNVPPSLNDMDPLEAFRSDKFTRTLQSSWPSPL